MEQNRTFKTRLAGFLGREDGAITVDWIVLTAGVVGLGMAAAFLVGSNVPGLADQISTTLETTEMGT